MFLCFSPKQYPPHFQKRLLPVRKRHLRQITRSFCARIFDTNAIIHVCLLTCSWTYRQMTFGNSCFQIIEAPKLFSGIWLEKFFIILILGGWSCCAVKLLLIKSRLNLLLASLPLLRVPHLKNQNRKLPLKLFWMIWNYKYLIIFFSPLIRFFEGLWCNCFTSTRCRPCWPQAAPAGTCPAALQSENNVVLGFDKSRNTCSVFHGATVAGYFDKIAK